LPPTLEPILPHIPAFLMVLFRLGGIFIFAPMFGSSVIPVQVKALLALALAVCVYPLVPPQTPIELTFWAIAPAIATEMLIGLAIGYGASLPLIAMQLGGMMIGAQLGLGVASVLNPDTDEENSVMSQMLFLMALSIFLIANGHHVLLSTLVGSFEGIPLGGYRPDFELLGLMTGLLGAMFDLALRVAAPLLCLIFLETIAIGFISKTVPQLNIMVIGFPLRIIMGFALTAMVLALISDTLIESIRVALVQMQRLFAG